MPKMKSKRGAAKRFEVTASGKIKHKHQNKRHILTKKSPKRKRHLRGSAIASPADTKNLRELILA